MKKLVQKNHYDYSAKLEAFPYQHEAFNEIKDKDYAAIFHEQGLGKTKIAIDPDITMWRFLSYTLASLT